VRLALHIQALDTWFSSSPVVTAVEVRGLGLAQQGPYDCACVVVDAWAGCACSKESGWLCVLPCACVLLCACVLPWCAVAGLPHGHPKLQGAAPRGLLQAGETWCMCNACGGREGVHMPSLRSVLTLVRAGNMFLCMCGTVRVCAVGGGRSAAAVRRRQPVEPLYGSKEVAEKRWRRLPRMFVETGVTPPSLVGALLRKVPAFLSGASALVAAGTPGAATGAEPEPELLTDLDAWDLSSGLVVRAVGVWGIPDVAPSLLAARLGT
jgi:hypothetical protein